MNEMTTHFCWHQNVVPWGMSAPAPGLYTCIKSWKKKYKIRFLWNLQQMGKVIRPFCWHQNFVPWRLSAPASGLYTCIKSWKKCIKSDFKEIFLKLATNDPSDKVFLLTSKFYPQGVVSACPGTIYMYKIMKKKMYKIKKCIKSDFKEIFLKLAGNDQSDKRFLLTSKFCPLGLSAPDLRLIYIYQIMKRCV